MINLIKNELTKIFHKKVIYILLIITLGYVVLTNVIYKDMSNETYSGDIESKEYIDILKQENKDMDLKKAENLDWYINNKTQIDVFDLQQKYGSTSWQASLVNQKLYDIIYQINYNTYSKTADKNALIKAKKDYDSIIKRFDNNDWRSFVNEEVKENEKELTNLEKELTKAKGTIEIEGLNSQIYQTKVKIECLKLRLEQNISYGNDYLNIALKIYESSKSEIYHLEKNDKRDDDEESMYRSYKKDVEENKYILDNKINVKETNSLKGIYQNFYIEYYFIIITIIIVISGVIVSEEYNKGTIKLLLIRPYSRVKILLSKYLSCLIMIILTILSLVVMQMIVGGITFGFESLSIPVINYNFNTSSLSIMNVFSYFGIFTLSVLPKILLLMTLSFSVGTLFGHSAIAIAVTLLGFIGSDIINYMVINNNVKFMRYWVTLNWDFDTYLFGGLPVFKYTNLTLSIIVCIAYFLIMIVTSTIVFKHKNIKNI